MGRCPDCGEWASMIEEIVTPRTNGKGRTASGHAPAAVPLGDIELADQDRTTTSLPELDRVLGGGLVAGSLVLIGGDPGIGKSTLLMQVSGNLASGGSRVLYISGEESPRQIKLRARRLGIVADTIHVSSETDASALGALVETCAADTIVVDSIQTMSDPSSPSAAGTVSQVRGSASLIAEVAKSRGIPAFIVGHVTKEGSLAGPRVLEHMVDTVLYFEGERDNAYRILRAVKNRFGATDEVGIFEMRGDGLAEVPNPSAYLLAERDEHGCGSVVCPTLEGTRPLLVEIQALAAPSYFPAPRRMASGVDFNRFLLVLAVLEKRAGVFLGKSDVYANVTGGLRLVEPATDLAVAVAVASSIKDVPVRRGTAVLGEVGLAGEVRGVSQAERRIREAARLGFDRVILSQRDKSQIQDGRGVELMGVRSVAQAVHQALADGSGS